MRFGGPAGQHSRLGGDRVQGALQRPVPWRRPAWSVGLPRPDAPRPRLTVVICGCTQCVFGNGGKGHRRSGRASRPRLSLPQVPQRQAAATSGASGGRHTGQRAGRQWQAARGGGVRGCAPRVAARQATAAGSSAPGGSVRACGVRLLLMMLWDRDAPGQDMPRNAHAPGQICPGTGTVFRSPGTLI